MASARPATPFKAFVPALCSPSVSKFNGVHSLDLYFSGSFGADFSEIHFIGLKGEFSEVSLGFRVYTDQRGLHRSLRGSPL